MATQLGFKLVFNHFGKVRTAVRQEVSQVVDRTCKAIEAGAKAKVMNPPKTGRVYKRGNVVHQASAPREAPATDTGDLAGSITSRMRGPMSGEVDVGSEHGLYLEYGTVKTDRLAPRPFLGPSVEEEKGNFERGLAAAIGRGAGR